MEARTKAAMATNNAGPPGWFAEVFATGHRPSEEVLKEYGKWQPPDEMLAR